MVGLAQHPDQHSMKPPVLHVIGCVVAPHASWKPPDPADGEILQSLISAGSQSALDFHG
jgi:hypothetical protein